MESKVRDFIPLFAIVLGCGMLIWSVLLPHREACRNNLVTVSDTIVIRDTITVEKPIVRDSLVVRYKRIEVPVIVKDTILDTVYVELPITSKYYRSSRYEAWVSGYQASLDSISVFSETKYIKDMVKTRKSRWGLGVSVGYGATRTRIEPFIGISVNYNIVTW